MKKKWEYITVLVSDTDRYEEFNQSLPPDKRIKKFKDVPDTIETDLSVNLTYWGEKGWKLISFSPHSEHLYRCVFERREK